MNNDYNVTRRHSAVMERLRRRIELFRQHHNSCESRYDGAALERLELERQHTFNLHQRCLQAKAKRTSKHRQPPPSSTATADQGGARASGGGGTASSATEHTDGTAPTAEQSRNNTLIALQETVKRKLESASSPLSRDQVNGFSDGFPPNKKACRENGANGSPLDSKLGISDALSSNGAHMGAGGESADSELGSNFQRKEMKQEPDDILPIAPPSGGGSNSLFPDLNEQEWSELMEELNSSVVYEDIQDIFNDGGLYGDRKDPLDAPSAPTLLPPDLSCVKAEFSPASVAFDADSRTGSPHIRSGQPPLPTSSPSPSPAVPAPTQQAPPPRPLQAPPTLVLAKDLSPAQQLQQLAAQQQRAQHLHGQMQHKPPQQGAKLHHQGAHPHPQHATAWPPMANASQSPLGGAYVMDKPTSPSLYTQDFNPSAQKQLLMAPNKGSPKGGGGAYLQGPPSHPNMMTHMTQGQPLSHPPPTGVPGGNAVLTFNNTKPLSHFEAGPGPGPRPPNPPNHNKAALLTLLRQQQQIKQKNSMSYRQHLTHTQEQNSYPAPPHGAGPTNAMVSTPGGNAMVAQVGGGAMPGNHGNAAYMNSQAVAAAIKQQQQQQQQILEQQKQQQYLQRQQLMAEQEKQQLQRHLTRPPPQYKDQSGPSANQNPFPQQPVSQFTASSQPMGSVGSMGGPAPSSRMFPQNQSLMGMNSNPAAPQSDVGLQACGGGGANVDVLYSSMSVHQGHVHAQSAMQRQQQQLAMSAPYRQNMIQQHLKTPNATTAAIIKQQQQQQQQQLAVAAAQRHPGSMGVTARQPGAMPGSMGGGQSATTWQQLTNQSASSNAFTNQPTAFHVQQRLKMPSGSTPFVTNPATGRPMGGLNQQMMHQRAPPTQQQPTSQSSDMGAFGQNGGRQGLQCNQGYQVSRAANQTQQVSLGYDAAAGSFAEESELVDSLLKAQSAQEWMADLDELLANHR
ncbi:mastermind-like protein 1 isoform X2 [Gouania willdenowi]|uniref:mastermind-like protein 1 isoform X2 n=1 Tax=Gouania willdenowi TaxID=441366 RepID=UPI001055D066|nr:mastermind-like protein 1 isoform X2 [Gouania willdenowi]